MMTFLILLLHAFAASAAGGKATGPCQCDNGWQQVRYETTLHFRDVRLSLDAELRKAEWAAIVRAVFFTFVLRDASCRNLSAGFHRS